MLKKEILKKVRKWDENIGKLIVFAVTIIIAVGVLGTLAYFYNQSRKNATELSTLTSTTSSASDLINLKFCAGTAWTDTWHVAYDPVTDTYGLFCWKGAWSKKPTDVRGILSASCSSDTNNPTHGATACYKVNR